jgi:hypothetical protein
VSIENHGSYRLFDLRTDLFFWTVSLFAATLPAGFDASGFEDVAITSDAVLWWHGRPVPHPLAHRFALGRPAACTCWISSGVNARRVTLTSATAPRNPVQPGSADCQPPASPVPI